MYAVFINDTATTETYTDRYTLALRDALDRLLSDGVSYTAEHVVPGPTMGPPG